MCSITAFTSVSKPPPLSGVTLAVLAAAASAAFCTSTALASSSTLPTRARWFLSIDAVSSCCCTARAFACLAKGDVGSSGLN